MRIDVEGSHVTSAGQRSVRFLAGRSYSDDFGDVAFRLRQESRMLYFLAIRTSASAVLMLCFCSASWADTVTAFASVRGDRTSGWLAQSRSEVLARNGVVATSQPLAAQAGLQILQKGGNAFDAAVATAAVLNLVEPVSAGMGDDTFVIAWVARERKLIALNASGRAPGGATPAHLAERGFTKRMPLHGIESVTVPGAVNGWNALLRRAGTLTFKETLEPAAQLAEQGFGLSERIRNDWIYGAQVLQDDPDSVKVYLPGGRIPEIYSIFRNPDLARAFRLLQKEGRDAFYEGDIARAIVAKSRALGGTMTLEDLAQDQPTWETPLTTNYHGYDIYEMPPNTQGFAVLEMLNVLEVCAPRLGVDLFKLGPRSPEYWHLLVEAKKLAYTDLYAFNADPGFVRIPEGMGGFQAIWFLPDTHAPNTAVPQTALTRQWCVSRGLGASQGRRSRGLVVSGRRLRRQRLGGNTSGPQAEGGPIPANFKPRAAGSVRMRLPVAA
jgi:gamma-glutamyltranspeptidase/glutathione hydrolase